MESARKSSYSAPTSLPSSQLLGRHLLNAGHITEALLEKALAEAERSGKRIGYVLVRDGFIAPEVLGQYLSEQYGVKYTALQDVQWEPELLTLLPSAFLKLKQVLPLKREAGKLVVVTINPKDTSIVDEITFMTGIRPELTLTTSYEFEQAMNHLLIKPWNMSDISDLVQGDWDLSLQGTLSDPSEESIAAGTILPFRRNAEPSIPMLVDQLLRDAIDQNVHDIHFEPRSDELLVRFRVDGILKTHEEYPLSIEPLMMARLKVLAQLDTTNCWKAQDGRIDFDHLSQTFPLRISTLPMANGREKAAIRVLKPFNRVPDFIGLGLDWQDIEQLQQLCQAPSGLILICGPTGSGKTTTLYSVLNRMNHENLSICTVEDPIEIEIAGINQSQVNTRRGHTFESSIRSLLRQDADVLMIGEIRDQEALKTTIEASLSGHLVLSTIHSSDTSSALYRLIEWGVPVSVINASVIGIIAQRLIRTLCPHCKETYPASPDDKELLFPDDPAKQAEPLTLAMSTGCPHCDQTGFSGRTGIFEILTLDSEIRHLLNSGASSVEIEVAASIGGMRTLAMCGREKVLQGHVSLFEVLRMIGS